jgi:hypothetical protein
MLTLNSQVPCEELPSISLFYSQGTILIDEQKD